jgi:hypothetical protein
MNGIQSLLQELPAPVRKTLYALIAIVGLVLAILQTLDVNDLGPLTMTQALQIYAFLSPLVGAVAVANVSKPAPGSMVEAAGLGELVQDYDLDMSAFEPVGEIADVYGEAQGSWSP